MLYTLCLKQLRQRKIWVREDREAPASGIPTTSGKQIHLQMSQGDSCVIVVVVVVVVVVIIIIIIIIIIIMTPTRCGSPRC